MTEIKQALEKFFSKKDDKIKAIIEKLGNKRIIEKCQFACEGDEGNLGKPISEGAKEAKVAFKKNAEECPAASLIDVVMASGRDYNKIVKPSMIKIRGSKSLEFVGSKENSIESLQMFLKKKLKKFHSDFIGKKATPITSKTSKKEYDKKELDFLKKELFFNDSAPKKMYMLISIINKILEMKKSGIYSAKSDYELMNLWASDPKKNYVDENGVEIVKNIEVAFGEKIKWVGPATIQHLRMHFGVNTFKPDQRVKEVLIQEFLGLDIKKFKSGQLKDTDAILMMEKIRTAVDGAFGQPDKLILDSILVNYGSGYTENKARN